MNPITRQLGRRPASERFDPTTTFYVEAAQYGDGVTRNELAGAVRRALDAMGAIRAGGMHFDEGWLVVVRCGGPRFDLPALLETENCRRHLTVIDVAPVAEPAHEPEPSITVAAAELH
ncbi:MAG: hypothetical protein ABSH51_05980 [Solirubrobacteraceae bacterium]